MATTEAGAGWGGETRLSLTVEEALREQMSDHEQCRPIYERTHLGTRGLRLDTHEGLELQTSSLISRSTAPLVLNYGACSSSHPHIIGTSMAVVESVVMQPRWVCTKASHSSCVWRRRPGEAWEHLALKGGACERLTACGIGVLTQPHWHASLLHVPSLVA